MKIIIAPNPVLSQKAKPVEKINPFVLKAIDGMKKALASAKDPIGVGLAAPQIGKLLRIFIVRPSPKTKTLVFLNPVIKKLTHPTSHVPTQASHVSRPTSKLEGCLSLKDIWGNVLRSPTVKLYYIDEKGQKHTRTFKELLATIIQHEIDHLDGILFTKRVLQQRGKLYQSHKDKKGEDIFEPIEI